MGMTLVSCRPGRSLLDVGALAVVSGSLAEVTSMHKAT